MGEDAVQDHARGLAGQAQALLRQQPGAEPGEFFGSGGMDDLDQDGVALCGRQKRQKRWIQVPGEQHTGSLRVAPADRGTGQRLGHVDVFIVTEHAGSETSDADPQFGPAVRRHHRGEKLHSSGRSFDDLRGGDVSVEASNQVLLRRRSGENVLLWRTEPAEQPFPWLVPQAETASGQLQHTGEIGRSVEPGEEPGGGTPHLFGPVSQRYLKQFLITGAETDLKRSDKLRAVSGLLAAGLLDELAARGRVRRTQVA